MTARCHGLQEPLSRYFAAAAKLVLQARADDAVTDSHEPQLDGHRLLRRLRFHCYDDSCSRASQLAGRVSSLTDVDVAAYQPDDSLLGGFLLTLAERTPAMAGLRHLVLDLSGVTELHDCFDTFFASQAARSLQRVRIAECPKSTASSLLHLLQLLLGCSQLTELDISNAEAYESQAATIADAPLLPHLHTLNLESVAFQPGSLLRLLSGCPALVNCRLANSSALALGRAACVWSTLSSAASPAHLPRPSVHSL